MKSIFVILLTLSTFLAHSQEQYVLSIDTYQIKENSSIESQVRFPNQNTTIVVGGLNNLDGIGHYINVFGSKLRIDSMNMISEGRYLITLRREDGKNIYNMFPTLRAKLTPVKKESLFKQDFGTMK